ncbi:MAG: serine/threonine protein kinase [Bythopirellula sp.]
MIEPPVTSAPSECPASEAILMYASGGLDDQRAEHIEAHLLGCHQCESLLDTLDDPSDAVIQALAMLPMTPDDEAAYQQLRKSALSSPVEFANSAEASAQLQHASRLADPELGPLPCRLGSYELLACIGRGASGAVYRARHLKLNQTAAVKVLDSSRSIDPESFLQEMKTIGSLTHPNIVRATDAGEADGVHFLVMEYVDGIDAARLLFRHGPLQVADACEIVRQAALGLQFIHEQSLIHRDVKPSNLLVTVTGQVKLLDLGIATRSDEQTATDHSQLRPQGTYDYMAPEAWNNTAAIDRRSDLYSLGCTLYKLLAARVPSREGSLDAAVLAPLPRALQRLLQSLLAADPQQRPGSMHEVIRSLEASCRGANLTALIVKTSPQLAALVPPDHAAPAGVRQSVFNRRTALAATAIAAGAALLLPKLNFFSSPTLKRLAWRPLEPVEPKIILANGGTSAVDIRTERPGELAVTSDNLALVHLGRPVNGLFSLAADIVPNASPNCGIFFKGQFDYSQPTRTFHFQSVELLRVDAEQSAPPEYHLLWSQWAVAPLGSPPDIQQVPLANVIVQLARPATAQNLQVTCGRQGMPEIQWNGKPVHESKWQLSSEGRIYQRLSAGLLPTAFLGRIGLMSTQGTTVFRQPRLAYL